MIKKLYEYDRILLLYLLHNVHYFIYFYFDWGEQVSILTRPFILIRFSIVCNTTARHDDPSSDNLVPILSTSCQRRYNYDYVFFNRITPH